MRGCGLPRPQGEDEEYDEDIYGDYNEKSQGAPAGPDLGGLLQLGGGLVHGFFGLLGEKMKFVSALLSDQELQRSVHQTLGAGLNLTGEVVRVAVPAVGGVVGSVLDAGAQAVSVTHDIVRNKEVQERVGSVVGAGANVAQGLGRTAVRLPNLVGQGTRLAGSVLRAANDTAPLVLQGIREFQEQLPLIAGFASAYAEVNAEQAQTVSQTFYKSLQCDLQCRDLVEGEAKRECELKFCGKSEGGEV